MVLVIAWGYGEFYYIMPSHVKKDSSMECHLIARTLDHLRKFEGFLPQSLLISADNTTREAKNSTFATFVSYLVGAGHFRDADVHFLTTGHTHNAVDQRFSTCAAILARAATLEDVLGIGLGHGARNVLGLLKSFAYR